MAVTLKKRDGGSRDVYVPVYTDLASFSCCGCVGSMENKRFNLPFVAVSHFLHNFTGLARNRFSAMQLVNLNEFDTRKFKGQGAEEPLILSLHSCVSRLLTRGSSQLFPSAK